MRPVQVHRPEKVISLRPQLDFRAATAIARASRRKSRSNVCVAGAVRRQEYNRARHRCLKALDAVGSAKRLDVIKMCEDCRVTVTEEDFDPAVASGAAHLGRLFARA